MKAVYKLAVEFENKLQKYSKDDDHLSSDQKKALKEIISRMKGVVKRIFNVTGEAKDGNKAPKVGGRILDKIKEGKLSLSEADAIAYFAKDDMEHNWKAMCDSADRILKDKD